MIHRLLCLLCLGCLVLTARAAPPEVDAGGFMSMEEIDYADVFTPQRILAVIELASRQDPAFAEADLAWKAAEFAGVPRVRPERLAWGKNAHWPDAIWSKEETLVAVAFVIGQLGQVQTIQVLAIKGHEMEDSAVRYVRSRVGGSTFRPATIEGKPVNYAQLCLMKFVRRKR